MPIYSVRVSVHDVRKLSVEAPNEKEARARAYDAVMEDGHAGTLIESDAFVASAELEL